MYRNSVLFRNDSMKSYEAKAKDNDEQKDARLDDFDGADMLHDM